MYRFYSRECGRRGVNILQISISTFDEEELLTHADVQCACYLRILHGHLRMERSYLSVYLSPKK